MKKLAIISAGHSGASMRGRYGDFSHWFRCAMGLPAVDITLIDAIGNDSLPPADSIRGAIITGSAHMVTEHLPWSENLAAWIRQAIHADVPLLGVCYGHQLMAYALGGQVGNLKTGHEVSSQCIKVTQMGQDDALVGRLPLRFLAHTYHLQTVCKLPTHAQVLASSDKDPYHVLRYTDKALSVQFHPEFSVAIMAALIRRTAPQLSAAGLDTQQLLKQVRAAPYARQFLRLFNQATHIQDKHLHKDAA